ncbi:hypothetical protein M427DRAFT_271213 [Gonapodya prolifera JEL478]|uniref:Uncharacterized protein n=1 Tax=Gonapodya prolifera (strain JEL478) TaxID=1344416 RepID=A0A139AXJ6_GONPJ|nr:hypothetical protein M427DRAFT_271213 [Gonapodya prolifera JEL478]|eukprot:KXS21471.1 hypothetical protein M427DRAFT_271213 [Gonapodya prolifera JEL478]
MNHVITKHRQNVLLAHKYGIDEVPQPPKKLMQRACYSCESPSDSESDSAVPWTSSKPKSISPPEWSSAAEGVASLEGTTTFGATNASADGTTIPRAFISPCNSFETREGKADSANSTVNHSLKHLHVPRFSLPTAPTRLSLLPHASATRHAPSRAAPPELEGPRWRRSVS